MQLVNALQEPGRPALPAALLATLQEPTLEDSLADPGQLPGTPRRLH
ncbi:hypothetical protein [Acidovorax sp. SUPP1855]|nr:hypothetical protein [Acidovorax sp. SUPP1855]